MAKRPAAVMCLARTGLSQVVGMATGAWGRAAAAAAMTVIAQRGANGVTTKERLGVGACTVVPFPAATSGIPT